MMLAQRALSDAERVSLGCWRRTQSTTQLLQTEPSQRSSPQHL
jgi:hypothetical protein